MISGNQVRAARALLDWTQEELAASSGVAERTIRFFEAGTRQPYDQTVSQLRTSFEAAGIVFIESEAGVGVMLVSKSLAPPQ